MRRLLLLVMLALGADYVLVAAVVFVGGTLFNRQPSRRLAERLNTTMPATMFVAALQWPWLAWRFLTGRAQ